MATTVGHIYGESWWATDARVAGTYWHGACTLAICNRSCMPMYRACEWKTIFHSNLWGFSLRCLDAIYDQPLSVSGAKHKSLDAHGGRSRCHRLSHICLKLGRINTRYPGAWWVVKQHWFSLRKNNWIIVPFCNQRCDTLIGAIQDVLLVLR